VSTKDAYHGLKSLVKRKFGGGSEADVVLENLDSKPEVRYEPLRDLLEESEINADREMVEAAKQLIELVGTSQTAIGDHNVQVAGDVGTVIRGDVVMALATEIDEAARVCPRQVAGGAPNAPICWPHIRCLFKSGLYDWPPLQLYVPVFGT
jgi:hypothetical protein